MATTLPLILLPPSEGKAPGGDGPPWRPGAMALDLDERRARLLQRLRTAMRAREADRAKLLGVTGVALAAATEANRAVATTPTMPAIERYTGVLYEALDHASLSAAHRRRLDRSVLILSGLWGAVAPRDPVPAYRLKMGAPLPGVGRPSAWWRDDLSASIAERAGGRRVWNLLPKEHAAAWAAPEDIDHVTVRFLERRDDGSLAAVSHQNKFLKGALVRHLLAHPGAGPEDLRDWEHPSGFRLDPGLTERLGGATVVSLVGAAP
jgi:uncharacterized protein